MRLNWRQAGRVLFSVVIALVAIVLLAYLSAFAGWWAGTHLHDKSNLISLDRPISTLPRLLTVPRGEHE